MESTTSCVKRCTSRSMMRRHPAMSVGGAILTVLLIVSVVGMMPDIVRYIRIKMM